MARAGQGGAGPRVAKGSRSVVPTTNTLCPLSCLSPPTARHDSISSLASCGRGCTKSTYLNGNKIVLCYSFLFRGRTDSKSSRTSKTAKCLKLVCTTLPAEKVIVVNFGPILCWTRDNVDIFCWVTIRAFQVNASWQLRCVPLCAGLPQKDNYGHFPLAGSAGRP